MAVRCSDWRVLVPERRTAQGQVRAGQNETKAFEFDTKQPEYRKYTPKGTVRNWCLSMDGQVMNRAKCTLLTFCAAARPIRRRESM